MDRDKPCCLRSDTVERDVSSGITLFALSTFYLVLNKNEIYHPTTLKTEMDW